MGQMRAMLNRLPLQRVSGAPCRFADLERSLGEAERARAVYELAIAQPVLDMPEVLWKVLAGWLPGCRASNWLPAAGRQAAAGVGKPLLPLCCVATTLHWLVAQSPPL